MKKKLLSLLLALALTCSLTAPALADGWDTTTPEWLAWKTQWMAAHPDEVAAFDPYAYFELDSSDSPFWWYDSPEEYMETWGLETEEAFCDHVLDVWLIEIRTDDEHQAWLDQYEAAHPGAISAFDPDAWFMEHYYRDPKQTFMEDWGLETHDEFRDYMLEDYISVKRHEEELRLRREQFEAERPGVIAAFDADAWFAQEYSWWSNDKDDFMVWMDLNTEEDFYYYMLDEMISDVIWSQTWSSGRNQEIIDLGGVPGQLGIMLDGAYLVFGEQRPYAEQGVTYAPADVLEAALGIELEADEAGYAPLRAAAEAAGYEVLWDGPYQTAVLIDREGFIARADSHFTVLNGGLATFAASSEKNYASTMNVVVDWTRFNTLDGDKTYSMTVDMDTLTGPAGAEGSGAYDLSSLADMFRSILPPYDVALYEEEYAQYLPLLKGSFDVLLDQQSEMLYLQVSPLFTYLFTMAGKEYPMDMWLSQPVGDVWTTFNGAAPTVGSYLYLLEDADQWSSPVYLYQNLSQSADALAGLLGDDCFEVQGKDHVLTLNQQELCQLLDPENPEYYASEIQAFDLTLTVQANGTITGDVLCRAAPNALMGYGNFQLTADWSFSFTKSTLEMDFHIQNQGNLHLSITTANQESASTPAVTPPEGAVVIPVENLWG